MAEVSKTASQIAEEQRARFPEVARAVAPKTEEDDDVVLYHGEHEIFVPKCIPLSHPATYPMEWFKNHGWTKPVLTLPKLLPSDTYAGLKKPISDGILRGTDTSAHDIKLFLYFLLKDVKETVPIDWVSMGVVIATKGDAIGPLDLFKIQIDDASDTRTALTEHTDNDKLGYLILITGCYRISSERNEFYKEKLKGIINAQANRAGLHGNLVTKCLSALSFAYNDRELIKLFAGMDMFYNMFPNSEYARTREGTKVTHFKECAILSSLSYIIDIMQISADDFKLWIFTPGLAKDYNRINVPHQEDSVPHSYMPYMMDLQLAVKSPYTVSINPTLHFYIHLIGCAALQPRSINAKMFDTVCGLQAVIGNAILFYYANRRFAKSKPYEASEMDVCRAAFKKVNLGGAGSYPNPEPVAGASSEEAEDRTPFTNEPKNRDAMEWFKFLTTQCNGVIPDHIRRTVYKKWRDIKDPRPNTIGHYARTIAVAYLRR